jgi:ribonuclease P protein component
MRVVPRAVQDSRFNIPDRFSAAHRLLRKHGFGHVLQAEVIADRYFKIFFVRNKNANAKLGMIVGKKTLASAVDRNYVKRIIRETFRKHSVKMCNVDLVVMLRRPFEHKSSAQVDDLKVLFSRAENRCAG